MQFVHRYLAPEECANVRAMLHVKLTQSMSVASVAPARAGRPASFKPLIPQGSTKK